MIQDLENNEVFTTEYLNVPPKKGDDDKLLIIGVFCDIEGSTEINVQDTDEIAEAAWLTRDEIHKKYKNALFFTSFTSSCFYDVNRICL